MNKKARGGPIEEIKDEQEDYMYEDWHEDDIPSGNISKKATMGGDKPPKSSERPMINQEKPLKRKGKKKKVKGPPAKEEFDELEKVEPLDAEDQLYTRKKVKKQSPYRKTIEENKGEIKGDVQG